MNLKEKINWRKDNFIKHHFPFLWSKRLSKKLLGKSTNFSAPKDLNEKIQWLMFYTDTSLWTTLADKYKVRDYVTERVGGKYLVPLIGKWENVEDIVFDALPDKFVLKPNNGSYDTIICTTKEGINNEEVKRKLAYSLSHKFGYENAEPHYLNIKPCIIAEQLLESDDPGGLKDYKIWCFNGKPYFIFICANRDYYRHKVDFICYDTEWNFINEYLSPSLRNSLCVEKPDNLEEMLEIASKLSVGLPQVRVDLYNINGKIYFGELTLSSNFGMMQYFTQGTLNQLGDLISLPTRNFKERIITFKRRWLPRF